MRLGKKAWLVGAMVLITLGAAYAETWEPEMTVYEWGAMNNRVLTVMEYIFDEETGLVEELRMYDNGSVQRPELTAERDPESLIGRARLVSRTDSEIRYESWGRYISDNIRFQFRDYGLLISADNWDSPVRVEFDDDGRGYTKWRDEESISALAVTETKVTTEGSGNGRRLELIYDEDGNYTLSRQTRGEYSWEATVQPGPEGYYLVEMPPYGDPADFSERWEVWTDRRSRGSLLSGVVNSYFLGWSGDEYIWPFFLPTPGEILAEPRGE